MAIAYQTIATAKTIADVWMSRFADVLQDLVVTRGLTNVRWVSIANEPNSTTLTLPQYEALYRALDAQLRARGLRGQIGLIGGDLVELTEGTASSHRAWFDYMVAHMNDVIDAWSEHIYWNYDDHFRMEERLKDVAHLVDQELPASARKPTFIMEYGVRGYNTCGTKPQITAAYYRDADCTAAAAHDARPGSRSCGSRSTRRSSASRVRPNWDLYWSIYDRTKPRTSRTGRSARRRKVGRSTRPTTHFALVFQTTAPGWQVLACRPVDTGRPGNALRRPASRPAGAGADGVQRARTAS